VTGIAVEQDGSHVVTTLGKGETGTPIRLVSVLKRGQSEALSTPLLAGPIEISRKDDSVFIGKESAIIKISRSLDSNPTTR